jgi:hypothetical protein
MDNSTIGHVCVCVSVRANEPKLIVSVLWFSCPMSVNGLCCCCCCYAVPKTSTLSGLGEEETGEDNKDGLVKLTKVERRAKLKKQKREAKKQGKELDNEEEVQQAPQAAVLVLSNWSCFLPFLSDVIKVFNLVFSSL